MLTKDKYLILLFGTSSRFFKYLPKVEWSLEMLFPIFSTVLIAVEVCFHEALFSSQKLPRRPRSTLEIASGYSNISSFIDFSYCCFL